MEKIYKNTELLFLNIINGYFVIYVSLFEQNTFAL